MKKFLCMMVAVFAFAISAFAYNSATCRIQNGDGASVVAEVTGGGEDVVYISIHNDANKYVNVEVEIIVRGATFSKTILAKPLKSTPAEISTRGLGTVSPNEVRIAISGTRCE